MSGKIKEYYKKLPDEFNRGVADKLAIELSINKRTAENYLYKFRQQGLIIHEHNFYKKIRITETADSCDLKSVNP